MLPSIRESPSSPPPARKQKTAAALMSQNRQPATGPVGVKGENKLEQMKRRSSDNVFKSLRRNSLPEADASAIITNVRRGSFDDISGKGLDKPLGAKKSYDVKRRVSVPTGTRRLSIGSLGRNVTSLLRAKNAFTRLGQRKSAPQIFEVDDSYFEIKVLPEKPRFASTLSIEAQYAMLKGYEDKVHENISNQFPEYLSVLRRSKTPHFSVQIKHSDYHVKTKSTEQTGEAVNDADRTSFNKSPTRTSPGTSSNQLPAIERSMSPRLVSSSSVSPTTTAVSNENATNLSQGQANSAEGQISTASPSMDMPKLVMTYRYESAMDILDALRERQGMYRLSPRKTSTVTAAPIKEYNSWSYVWSNQFEPAHAVMKAP